jgi:hypothetical protein
VAKKTQAKKAKPKVKSKSSASRAKVTKVVQGARKKAATIAANPAVTEVVAASLVAAAAAIRDPKKARDIATIVGAELETASKQAVDRGNAFWKMALDIAKRSIDALGGDSGRKKAKPKAAKKAKAKPATKAKPRAKAKAPARKKPKK